MKSLGSVVLSLLLVACASTPPPRPETSGATTTSSAITKEANAAPEPVACDLVCEQAMVVPRPADGPDYHALATENANTVLKAMHPDLLACYAKRVAASPNAHAFLTFDVVIGPDGTVRDVQSTGGALLGQATMSCLENRIRRGVFAAPHGGGTLHVHVPFSLVRAAKEEI